MDGKGLLAYYDGHTNIKLVKGISPWAEGLETRDASFYDKQSEDDLYLKDLEAVARLRRGNSLALIKGDKGIEVIITRRGLPKFFDLRQEHLKVMMGLSGQQDLLKHGSTVAFEYRMIVKVLVDALAQGNAISVYRTGKANGENAQISLIDLPGTGEVWVACSKNVSLLFNSESQIDLHTDQRFKFAKLIAHSWLKTFNALKPEAQAEVKTLLKTHTLIGEYCGHPQCQHLVLYSSEKLIFYGIVPKDCSTFCMPVSKMLEFLQRVGLEHVSVEIVKDLTTLPALAQCLQKMNNHLAVSSVQDEGEGSVCYFEVHSPEAKVLSICKLKTLEYRLLRKIREKMKKHLRRKMDKEKTLKKYEHESEELFSEYPEDVQPTLPKISDYTKVLDKGIDLLDKGIIPLDTIETNFIDVLNLVKLCEKESRLPTQGEIDKLKQAAAKDVDEDDDNDSKSVSDNEDTEVNICLLDVPGLFNVEELCKQVLKKGYTIKFEYNQKRSSKKTFRFVPISANSISTKKMRESTFILVPSIKTSEGEDLDSLKTLCQQRVVKLFQQSATPGSLVSNYLKMSVNNVSTLSNIDNCIDLAISRVGRIDKSRRGLLYIPVDKQWEDRGTDSIVDNIDVCDIQWGEDRGKKRAGKGKKKSEEMDDK